MEAGVVDFKICNHCFDCANCEFDQAMTAAAAQNQAMRQAGEPLTGDRGGIYHFKQKQRQRSFDQLLEDQLECFVCPDKAQGQEVFGFRVEPSRYLHRGHAWAALESAGRVRIGLDDFSQKILGPADEMKLPHLGEKAHLDTVGLVLARQGKKAKVLSPITGVIEVVNPKVRQTPSLVHDDPYGEGWLMVVTPTNLKPDLEHMLFGQRNITWIENESNRLLGMLESSAGVTLPSGGTIIDDVYGHYPQLGWERLVQEFLHTV